jgi:tetratricopeptide (TPR) repeat protein
MRSPLVNRINIPGWLVVLTMVGCVHTGPRSSIWPTWKTTDASGGMASKFSSTAQGVKGQLSTMGTAVTSAYGKAKSSITSAWSGSSPTATEETANPKPTLGPEIFVANGQLYESTGQYTKALDNYSKALEVEPKNASALLAMARLHQRQNEHAKAVEFFKKASEVNPADAQVFNEIGNCLAKQGQLVNARQEIQKAVNLQPKNRVYRMSMAGILLEEGKSDEALSELAQVDPPAMANYQMASLYFGRQNIPAAQQHLSTALQIDPNLQPARDLLNQMGGGQLAQQAMGAYQGVDQTWNALQNAFPANASGIPGAMPPMMDSPLVVPSGGAIPAGTHPLQSSVQPATLLR